MSKYTEAEIARIINDCEVLFVPEGSTIEEAEYARDSLLTPRKKNVKSLLLTRYLNEAEFVESTSDEDFEKIFQASKTKKQTLKVSSRRKY